jgi:formylglycine-generating enzyme required for sulfatase activity/cephalosporin-C deacetylase-like acetyl esterase/predicted Ser/Thr protein kinase
LPFFPETFILKASKENFSFGMAPMKCPQCGSDNTSDSRFCKSCATPLAGPGTPIFTETLLAPAKELVSGSVFAGRYQVIEELGRGGMGRVYRVLDKKVGEEVALKLIKPEIAADEKTILRFRNELRTARNIGHPNVTRMYDLGEDEGAHYITMEYVRGEDLKSFIRRSGRLTVDKAVTIAGQVAEGLAEAHRQGVVHRDLKPQNIMIDRDGNARIMDFGIARSVKSGGTTGGGVMIGTPEYMSPEQVEGKTVDQRSDLYSLGIILYEMLTGRVPFKGDSVLSVAMKQKSEPPPDPQRQNLQIPDSLSRLILKCLKKEATERYQTAEDLVAGLKAVEKDFAAGEKASLQRKHRPSKETVAGVRRKKYAIAVAAALAVLVLSFFAVRLVNHQSKVRWARQKALPKIMELIRQEKYVDAFKEARQAEKIIPHDPTLARLWPEMSREVTIETDPAGADVFLKDYKTADEDWDYLGKSPLEKVRIPFGYFRWKIEKQSYRMVERASEPPEDPWRVALDQEASLPAGMVRVPGGEVGLDIAVLRNIPAVELEDFLMDKYEVTNRQFKEFIDRGGYQERTYWKYPFKIDGKALSWDEVMARFRDATGRPGPATWELGTYPEGQADFPVSGVSWYEAAAYAESVAKSLPTIFHWVQAANLEAAPYIIPTSNFGGKGPVEAGSSGGLSPSGAYDMAGNVREWCSNESHGLRYLMGGAWDSPSYMFSIPFALSPSDRSASNGFRCIKSLSRAVPEAAMKPVPIPYTRDFYKEKPISDEVFNIYKRQFAYDKGELNSVVESTDESSAYWKKEKISFNAAYGNERVTAYLFLPRKGAPPYQTIIYFPGSDALYLRSSKDLQMERIDLIIKSGRAALYPVYKSTYERGDGFDLAAPMNSWRDHVVFWVRDLARSIDYLETRVDIDSQKIGYLGSSLGGMVGVMLLPWEKRVQACVLLNGGFVPMAEWVTVPEIDFINLAPRVTIPALMLNGRYDFVFPVETSQKPMFDFLGTPREQKKYILYDTAHDVPRNEMIKEVLNWFDLYLGPVR